MIQTALPVRTQLTQRQADILDFITRFIEEHRYSPSYRDLCAHFQVQINTIRGHLVALRRKGYIEFDARRSRTIRVTETDANEPCDLEVLALIAWSCVHAPLEHLDQVADRLGCDRVNIAGPLERLRSRGLLTWEHVGAEALAFQLLNPTLHELRNEQL